MQTVHERNEGKQLLCNLLFVQGRQAPRHLEREGRGEMKIEYREVGEEEVYDMFPWPHIAASSFALKRPLAVRSFGFAPLESKKVMAALALLAIA